MRWSFLILVTAILLSGCIQQPVAPEPPPQSNGPPVNGVPFTDLSASELAPDFAGLSIRFDVLVSEDFFMSVSPGVEESAAPNGLSDSVLVVMLLDETANLLDQIILSIFIFSDEQSASTFFAQASALENQTIFESEGEMQVEEAIVGEESKLFSFSDIAGPTEVFGRLYHNNLYARKGNVVVSVLLTKRSFLEEDRPRIIGVAEEIFSKFE